MTCIAMLLDLVSVDHMEVQLVSKIRRIPGVQKHRFRFGLVKNFQLGLVE